jgi:hypothetical protein
VISFEYEQEDIIKGENAFLPVNRSNSTYKYKTIYTMIAIAITIAIPTSTL